MKLTKELLESHQAIAKLFFYDTVMRCKKEGKSAGEAIELLHKSLQMCQTLLFCFMADVRSESSVASIYGDMREMSLDALDMIVNKPEILLNFSTMGSKGPEQSTLDVIELFKEIRDSQED